MNSASTNLLSFPPRPPEPVDAEQLRANSRELLEIEALEAGIQAERRLLHEEALRLKRLKEFAKKERRTLLERLARGAQLAG